MRKYWTFNELDLALDGPKLDLTYDYDHLGDSTDVLQQLADGTHPYSARLPASKAPVGSESLQREDDGALMRVTQQIADKVRTSSCCGPCAVLNVLHRVAGQPGGSS